MKKHLAFVLSAASFFSFASSASALDPRELIARSKAGFQTELEGARRAGDASAAQAQQEALVEQKDQLQELMTASRVKSEPAQKEFSEEFTTQMVAQAAPPVQVGYSGGSTYPFLYFDPRVQGRGYALSDSSGFYRTDNGGTTWTANNTGLQNLTIASLGISPSNSNILYAGTVSGVHRSADGGRTWTFLPSTANRVLFRRLENYRALAVGAADPNRVYAGTSTGQVFLTTNGGSTWTQLGNLNIGAVAVSAVHAARNGRVFAGTSRGLFQWNGSAWQKITLQSDNVRDIVSTVSSAGTETIYVTNGLRVARTTNTGTPTTWTYSAALPPYDTSNPGHINRLAVRINSSGQSQILATHQREWSGRIYLSSDNGATWRNLAPNNAANFVNDPAVNPTRVWKKGGRALFLSVAFNPFSQSTFLVSDDWGIWRTTDSGGTWLESVAGTPNIIGTELVYDPRTQTYLMSSMDNGLVEYNPANNSWRAVFPTASTGAQYYGHVWKTVVMTNGNRLVSAAPWNDGRNSLFVIRPDGSVVRANGLPASYPRTNTVWQQGYGRSIVYHPSNPNRVYLGIDGDTGGLFVSNDGGFNWTRAATQPGNPRVYRMAIDPANPQILYWATMWAGTSGGVWRTVNGGSSWTRVFSGSGNIGDVVVAPNRTVYVGGQTSAGAPALWVSRDNGVTYSMLRSFDNIGTPGPLQAITVDPGNPRRLLVSSRKWGDYTGARIYATDDAGATWTEISAGLPNTSGAAKMVFAPDGRSVYVVMNAGTLFRIPLA